MKFHEISLHEISCQDFVACIAAADYSRGIVQVRKSKILPPPGSVKPEGKQVQTMGRVDFLRPSHPCEVLRTKYVCTNRGEREKNQRGGGV